MAYASASDLIARKDSRDLGDLVSDDGVQVAENELADDAKLGAALDDASGDIEASLLRGNRYTTAQLAALTGNSLAYLKRITCEIAMYHLLARRPEANLERLEYYRKLRETFLEPLASGENVFDITDHLAAGAADVDGPTTQDYGNLNLVRDRVLNYFPPRFNPDNR